VTIHLRLPSFIALAAALASRVLIVAGSLGVASYLWSESELWFYQRVQSARLREAPAVVEVSPTAAQPPAFRPAILRKILEPDPRVLGEIEIPRLHFRAVIRDGIDQATLRKAVGHVTSTPIPGDRGNSVIAGHRDTFFRALRGIEHGDTIRIHRKTGVVSYSVDSLAIVAPEAVEVMRPAAETRITLITCYPFEYVGPSPRRFVAGALAIRP
jgi:LPXTG-site transpeptidase (sortase) family protein